MLLLRVLREGANLPLRTAISVGLLVVPKPIIIARGTKVMAAIEEPHSFLRGMKFRLHHTLVAEVDEDLVAAGVLSL